MKIALFASAFHPHVGGVEELVRQLAHHCHAAGDEAIVLTNRWPRALPTYEKHEGIDVYRIPFRIPEGSLKACLSYTLSHRSMVERTLAVLTKHGSEVVHVQCVSTNAYYARLACEALKLPLIVTAQGELTMDADRMYEKSRWLQQILRDCVRVAAYVTGCSTPTVEDVRRWYGDPLSGRSSVVWNGVTVSEFDAAVPYSHPRPYVLGIGRWVTQKGFDILLQAFDRLGDVGFDLLLAGAGVEAEALSNLRDSLSAASRIHLLGRADHAKAVSLFKGCDVFVLPSRLEPFGIVNLEAMAASRPVIASAVGGVPEIVVDGDTGLLVPPDDVAALTAALRRLVDDADLRQRLGQAGRARVGQFDWSAICAQYRTLYRSVLEKKT